MREAIHKKLVQEYYSKRAGDYDKQKTRTWKSEIGFDARITNEIIGAALALRVGDGLEIGVGSGRVCIPLLRETRLNFVGIDLSKAMLKLAKFKLTCHGEKSSLILADAEHLPFRDETFNLVICVSTLHYFTSPELVLKETSRMLKRKGVFIYGDICIHEMDRTRFMDKLEKTISLAHSRYYKPSEMRRTIEKYGIRITKTKIIPYRKTYKALIEDKANYFNIKPEKLFHLIAKSTETEKTLYAIDKRQMTLFYTIIIGSKE